MQIMMKNLQRSDRNIVLKISAIYALFSCLWIYFSDTTLAFFVSDPAMITRISVYKGVLFVVVTSILIHQLISRYLLESIQLKKTIHSKEQLFNQLSEGMIDAYASVDLTGRILQFNEVFRAMLGYDVEELYSRSYIDITPEKWHSLEFKIIEEQVLPRGYSEIFEKEYRRKDGTVLPVELRIQLIRDEEGNPFVMWAIVRDITERKEAEEAIRLNEARLESQLRISHYDETKTIEEFLDYALAEALALTVSRVGYIYFYDESTRKFTLSSWSNDIMDIGTHVEKQTISELDKTGIWGETVRQKRPIVVNDFQAVHPLKKGYPEGHAPLYRFLTIPVIMQDRIVAVVGVANKPTDYNDTDVRQLTLMMDTVWKTTESKLSKEELNRKNIELEHFVYAVSHDLRSPLVTFKTFLGYLAHDMAAADNKNIAKDMEFMHSAANRMEALLNELLDLSRIGRSVNPHEEVTFRELASEAFDAEAGHIVSMKVTVLISDADLVLYGDRRRLLQIWQNLLDNAVKYMGDQAAPHIEIGVEYQNGETVFFVCDNGIGIAPEYHEKVFGMFEQMDRTSGGVGMGLTMVKRIVELYGGRIRVESRGGKQGSCFRFTLPKAVLKG
ncbi:MAG: GAF domain-containing protein [Desulfuromonadales bacterium]|nr:GAF domain-containing protein [Desulfuromonadales bacterium]